MDKLTHNELAKKRCRPCEGESLGYDAATVLDQMSELPFWKLDTAQRWISRTVRFKNFKRAIEFLNAVAVLAEKEGHHPDLHLIRYREVQVALTTHSIGGLSENDFIVAAKVDSLITETFSDAKVSE